MNEPESMKTTTLFGLLIVLVIIAGLLLSLSNIAHEQRILSIATYADCVHAGYPVMESYPSQCRTPDGRTFTNPDEENSQPMSTSSSAISANGCQVGGCSAQLCGEAGDDLVSNCEYRAEYGCYKTNSVCERQSDGKCGWTQTAELKSCLQNPPPLQ